MKCLNRILFIAILATAMIASGCKTNQILAKGLQGKAVTCDANAFIAEVTPANDVTHTPTGRMIIASGDYSSTPITKDGKTYVYRRVVRNPRIIGFIGGSSISVTVIAANDDAELAKIADILKLTAIPASAPATPLAVKSGAPP